jgi:hypothetical protein
MVVTEYREGDKDYVRVSNILEIELEELSEADIAAGAVAKLREIRGEEVAKQLKRLQELNELENTYLALEAPKSEVPAEQDDDIPF